MVSATLLTPEKMVLRNIPDILDVKNLIKLLIDMGVKVEKTGSCEYTFQADELDLDYLQSDEFVKRASSLRGSVLTIGPLLGRFGKATVAKPGGDKIGRRRLDTHFLGFRHLGATFEHVEGRNVYEIKADKLVGSYMLLDEASVTGTANIIMAAVLAEGTTTIYNAACEPYIQQLCHMLNRMGAWHKRHCQQPDYHSWREGTARNNAHNPARHDRGGLLHRHGCHGWRRHTH